MVRNITARNFGSFASVHDAVGNSYCQYFMQNWDDAIRTKEFEQYFLESEDNPEMHPYQH